LAIAEQPPSSILPFNDRVEKEGEETRGLITQNVIQQLRDDKSDLKTEVQALKSEGFTSALFGRMMGEIAEIKCQMVKQPPSFAATVMPDMHLVEPGRARRGNCDWQ